MRCSSLNRGGGPCKQFAQRGTDLCHYHAMVLPHMQCHYAAKERGVSLEQVARERGWLVVPAKGQPREPGLRLLTSRDLQS